MDLEIRALRIFCQVMRAGSFSAAARSLKITQPTVSQQIAKLEHDHGARLFERVGHAIVPTTAAKVLFEFAAGLLESVDEFRDIVIEDRKSPRGLVRYAMPETCQWTPHFRQIMKQIRDLPDIRFEIEILPSEAIVQGIIEARHDFGFVVGDKLAPELRFEKFSDERYSWVASTKDLLAPLAKKAPLRLMKPRIQEPTVRIGTLAGAIHAVKEGAGAAVFPTHCIASELSDGTLFELRPTKSVVAANPIYLARRVGAKHSRRVETVVEMLRNAKKSFG